MHLSFNLITPYRLPDKGCFASISHCFMSDCKFSTFSNLYTKCPMTKLMKNYQLFTFCWFKSLYPTLTNMSRNSLNCCVCYCINREFEYSFPEFSVCSIKF